MSKVTCLAFTTIIIITNIIITITITITNIEGHLDICLGSCLVWPWGPFFCTKPMLNTLWQISLQTNVFLPVFCFAFSFRSAVWLHWRKWIFNRKEIFVPLHWRCQCISACLLWPSLIGQKKMLKGNVAHTWILVWGLAWLGLTPSLALNLPWASLLPSPNFPSRVCRNIYFNPEYGRWWFMSWYWNVKISRELLRENIKKSFFGQNLNICSWSRLVRSCSALLCAEPKRVLLSLCESHVVL